MLLKRNSIFISEIDKLLDRFDKTHTQSPAQVAEVKKYQRIYDLRDNIQPQTENKEFWEG